MKKRILSLILAFMMCLSLFPAAVLAEAEEPVDSAPALETPELKIRNRASDGKPVLQWTAVNGAEKYEIYFAAGKNEAFSRLYTVKGLKLNHVSADTGKTYYYKVRAIIENGTKGEFSDVVRRTVDLSRPDVQVVFGLLEEKLEVSWKKIDQAQGYDVYCAVDGGKFTELLHANSNHITHGSAKGGHTYRYKVRALASRSAADSAWGYSETFALKLSTPDVHVYFNSKGNPEVSWNHIDQAQGYDVYCSADGGKFTKLLRVKGREMTHSSAKRGHTYRYKVRALASNNAFNSAWGYSDTVSPILPAPELSIVNDDDYRVELSWTPVKGADHYVLLYAPTEMGPYVDLKETKNTQMVHNVKEGTEHYYIVFAVESNGQESNHSNPVKHTCPLTHFKVTVSNKASTGKPVVKWNKMDGAVGYGVECKQGKNGEWKFLGDTKNTSITDTAAKVGKTYYYAVCILYAYDDEGTLVCGTPYSDVHYRTCDCARPVVKLSTNSADQPVLSWKKIDGAVKYEVYRSVNGGDFKFLSNVNGTKLTNGSARSGDTCRYKVRALGSRSTVDSAWCYTKTITVK